MKTKNVKELSKNELENIIGGCSCHVMINPDGSGCTDIIQPGWPVREPSIFDRINRVTL